MSRESSLRGNFPVLMIGLLILAALIVFGCSSSDNITAPSQDDFAADFFSRPYEEGPDGAPLLGPLVNLYASRNQTRIEANEGGTVTFKVSGRDQEFIVAPGSIPEDTTITVNVVGVEADLLGLLKTKLVILDFGPDGMQFNPNATLRFDASVLGNRKNFVSLFWLNPFNNRWEEQGSYRVGRDGKVNIPIHHFSKYGIS